MLLVAFIIHYYTVQRKLGYLLFEDLLDSLGVFRRDKVSTSFKSVYL